MPKPHKNDINIGKDEWITYISVDGRQENAIRLDQFIAPMEGFWSRLETECVAGCCGIDAFDFSPENIRQASLDCFDKGLGDQLAELKKFILNSGADIFVSSRLNQVFDRRVILQLLDHIGRHIATSAADDQVK